MRTSLRVLAYHYSRMHARHAAWRISRVWRFWWGKAGRRGHPCPHYEGDARKFAVEFLTFLPPHDGAFRWRCAASPSTWPYRRVASSKSVKMRQNFAHPNWIYCKKFDFFCGHFHIEYYILIVYSYFLLNTVVILSGDRKACASTLSAHGSTRALCARLPGSALHLSSGRARRSWDRVWMRSA